MGVLVRRAGRGSVAEAFFAGSALATMMVSAPVATAAAEEATVLLPPVSVQEKAAEGSYKQETVSSPKFTAPLLDTPRSVTIIPEIVIQQSGATSLSDVLRTTPGITLGSGEGGNPVGDRPFIRGFDAMTDTFVDGVRDTGSQSREVFNLESVEVSKGPGSSYTGRGSAGGSLNLVSKTPKAKDFGAASVTFGTDDTKRLTTDLNKTVTDTIAVRLNAMAHDADVAGRDEVTVSRWGVAPSITFGLGRPLRATLSYYHLSTDDMPDYGLPYNQATGKPVDVDRDTFYGLTNRDFRETTADTGTAQFEYDILQNLTVRNTTRYSRSTNDYIVTNPDDSAGNVARGYVWRSPKTRDSINRTLVNQTDLYGTANTGFLAHSFSAGAEFSREKTYNNPYAFTPAITRATNCNVTAGAASNYNCTTLNNPNPDDPWNGTVSKSPNFTRTRVESASAYVFDTLTITPQWSVNLGLRYDDYDVKAETQATGNNPLRNKTNFWNYQAGLVYKPVSNGSIYINYGTSSNPSGTDAGEGTQSVALNNRDLDPEDIKSYELGTKWELFQSKLMLTAAVFRNEKTNARVSTSTDSTLSQELIGEQRVDGVELGASGSITEQWHVFGGYTYLDAEIVDDGPTASNDGKRFPNTPRHSFNLWSTYDVTTDITLGGGATYFSRRYGNAANTLYVPSFWRFDAMASYQVAENVGLRLNVLNLTNERYYDKPYTTHFATVAPGRSATLTASFSF